MPTYDYKCDACEHTWEEFKSIKAEPTKKCPSCGKKGLKKLMSAPVFRLKGSGWYETDFKSDKENKRNLAGAEKEETKVEPKPEAKTEAKSETAKPETKPAADKPAATPVKRPAARSKTRPKGARAAKRPSRR